jgi:hypothetical protein
VNYPTGVTNADFFETIRCDIPGCKNDVARVVNPWREQDRCMALCEIHYVEERDARADDVRRSHEEPQEPRGLFALMLQIVREGVKT